MPTFPRCPALNCKVQRLNRTVTFTPVYIDPPKYEALVPNLFWVFTLLGVCSVGPGA